MTEEEFAKCWVVDFMIKHFTEVGVKDPRLFERIRSRKALKQIAERFEEGKRVYRERHT